jgi:tRNA pseudouridine38-40 synthase
MRNIRLLLEYEGTNYHGWQFQPNARTIQGEIQHALQRLTQVEHKVIGSSRTDAGVHAAGQVANFKTESKLSLEEFQRGLNALLPKDIVVLKCQLVDPTFHARRHALSRKYKYTILNRAYPSAIMRNFSYFSPDPLQFEAMEKAIKYLLGTHDFSSFRKSGGNRENPVCTVFDVELKKENELITFEIEADSFLRGMVRAIIGTLLKIGTGDLEIEDMKRTIEAKDRAAAGPSAPAHGLCLIEVKY